MSNPTSNFGWQMPTSTDLVTDLPADFEVFGQAVDTSMAGLKGGTTGQILSKTSNTNMAFTWIDPTTGDITGVTAGTGLTGGGTSGDVTLSLNTAYAIPPTIVDAKGDLIAATAADTVARLPIGTNGQILTADSTQSTGMKWATASSGGNNWVQISSPTVSGASSVSFTGLSGYKMLYLYMENFVASNTSTLMYVRLNANSSTVYASIMESFSTSGAARVSGGVDDAIFGLNFYLCDNTNRNHLGLFIDGANGGGYKWYEGTAQGNITSGGTSAKGYTGNGIFQSTSNISSIDLTFSGGTVTAYSNPILYGVA